MSKTRYDKKQLNRHPRRNKEQNKAIKKMITHLDLMFGENNTGMFLAMICDGLDKMMKKTPDEYINLRSIEIKFNDYYSIKLDCEKGTYIDE